MKKMMIESYGHCRSVAQWVTGRVARSKKSNSAQMENFHRQIPPNQKMSNFYCIFGCFRVGLLFKNFLSTVFFVKYCLFY